MKLNELLFGLVLSFPLFSQPVFAKSMIQPLARIETRGGISPTLSHRQLMVYSDGSVYAALRDQKFRLISKFSPITVEGFSKAIDEIDHSPLVLDDSQSYPCMDGPSTGYTVFKSDGSTVEIARVQQCRMLHLENGQGLRVSQILEGLESAAFFLQ